MKLPHSPRGGRLASILAILIGVLPQAFAQNEIPRGSLKVNSPAGTAAAEPQLNWRIEYPSGEATPSANMPADQSPASRPVLVRVTARTLAQLQARDPMVRLTHPPTSETKVARPTQQSIIGQSTVLHDGTHWTLVPKDAVVFLPETLKSRVNVRPVGTLLAWNEFLTRNQDWLATNEVTFDQAAGNEELPAESTTIWAKQGKLVVAVHQNGPISVRVAASSHNLTRR